MNVVFICRCIIGVICINEGLIQGINYTTSENYVLGENANGSLISTNGSLDNIDQLIESFYSITCCRGGRPVPDTSITQYSKNFESKFVGSIFADHQQNVTCDRYNGKYSVPIKISRTNDKDFSSGVKCQCPQENLDRNCRQLVAECNNGGYRAFSINLRCVCPGLYFGDLCEKYCLNGRLEKNEQQIVDRCVCRTNFYGDECQKIVCFNSGTPVNGRGCSCPPFIIGPHCETRIKGTNRQMEMTLGEWARPDGLFVGSVVPPFPEQKRQFWYRDATGAGASVILLALVIGFVVYYYIGKRRRNRRLMSESSNHVTIETSQERSRGHTENGVIELLAPLPTYEQAIKSDFVLNFPQPINGFQGSQQPINEQIPGEMANQNFQPTACQNRNSSRANT